MKRPWTHFAALTIALGFLAGQALATVPAKTKSENSQATAGWMNLPPSARSRISAAIAQDIPGYQARIQGQGFHFANAGQKLDVNLSRQGVVVRTGGDSWGLSLQGYGYGDALNPLHAVAPHAKQNLVEFKRGPLTEWYANGPMGLEQGFTIAKRPGRSNGQPLTLAMAFSSDLSVKTVDDKGFTLNQSGKPQLSYGAIAAWDADGQELNAWVDVREKKVLLRVQDANAHYPIFIDPTIKRVELTSSEGQNDEELGWNVAISGNTIAVGAPGATIGSNTFQGAVYIFVKPASGWANMTQTAKLTASDGTTYSLLGRGLGISGNTVVAGAPGQYTSQLGEAYIFVEPAGGWKDMTETARLTPSDAVAGNEFGYSAASSGNTVVVGAFGDSDEEGAAYVYVQPAHGWADMTETGKLTPSDGLSGNEFGYDVAIDDNTIVSGAFLVNGAIGAAYVYVEPEGGWTDAVQTAKLTPSDGKPDSLGLSVSVSGNTVVAGAFDWPGDLTFQGAAYVFVEPSGGWADMTQNAVLTASDGEANDELGYSIGISGDVVVVGAEGWPDGGGVGAIYAYLKPSSGWTNATQNLKLTGVGGAASLGYRLAISGTTAIAGAPFDSFDSNVDRGAAFVFTEEK
jgi:hypothetical protein